MPHGAGFGRPTGDRVAPPDFGQPLHGVVLVDGIEYAQIRRASLDASAGNGLGNAENGHADPMLLPRSWLMHQPLAAEMCALVRVRGDSVAPAIPDGVFLLQNAAERLSYAPGIYAFTRCGEAFAKRLAVTAGGPGGWPAAIVLIADNPAYPPLSLAGRDLESLVIVGRVRGVFAFLWTALTGHPAVAE